MKIFWNENKNKLLKKTRNVSFEYIELCIANKNFITIIENKNYINQFILIVNINNYVYAVPFLINEEKKEIFLKTIYPSRKYTKIYLGGEEK